MANPVGSCVGVRGGRACGARRGGSIRDRMSKAARPARPARARSAAPSRPRDVRATLPPWPVLALLAAWALLLLAAPAGAIHLWGVNGFRSVALGARVGLLAAAALAAFAVARLRGGVAWALLAALLALAVAFPLRERAHVLGDTDVRRHAIAEIAAGGSSLTPVAWSRRLHASALDLAIDVALPAQLVRAGLPVEDAVSCVGLALALAWLLALWRIAARAAPAGRLALAAALALTGALEAFAGYAESAPLLLAAVAWWWAELERPLDATPQSVRVALAWLAAGLAHRMGLVLVLPMLLRALGPALPGDVPRARRALLGATVAIALALLFVPGFDWGAGQAGIDLAPLEAALRALPRLPFADVANALLLSAPLALVAAPFARRDAWAGVARDPRTALALAGGVPLALIVLAGWAAGNGLGAHRDWDLATVPGLLLAVPALQLLAAAPAARWRTALAWAAPVLALQAGSWLAVNADARAGRARATALATDARALPPDQRGTLLMLLAGHAAEAGDPMTAAQLQRRAFELAPDIPRGTLAAEFLLMARDPAGARQVLARVHALGAPDTATAAVIRGLDSLAAAPPAGR